MKYHRVSTPYSGKVKIDFDSVKRSFFLSTEIFQSLGELPLEIVNYIEARKNHSFKPCKTSFRIMGQSVELIQEIPFQWGFQPTFRVQIAEFRRLGRKCYQTLLEIAVEEKVKIVEDQLLSLFFS